MSDYLVAPTSRLNGEILPPGDKSISHRTVMLGALAQGTTEAEGFLEGADALSTINAFRAMGVAIRGPEKGRLSIDGIGLHALREPPSVIDCGNSGTTMRLMSGILCGQKFNSTLIGDATLMRRPMRRVVEPLSQMGAKIRAEPNGCAPLRIEGGGPLNGIKFSMPQASAQVKSALLLAGLYAQGDTTLIEPETTRDHTERMLSRMGVKINTTALPQGARAITLTPPPQPLIAQNIRIPADFSSATFWLVAGSIARDAQSEIVLRHVGMNPSRNGAVDLLKRMGARIDLFNLREEGGEPVADLRVRPAALRGIRIPKEMVSLSIDEFPILFIAASCAEGQTKLTGASELRVKESDRLASMAKGLEQLGINHELLPDGIVIEGQETWNGTAEAERAGIGKGILTYGDHRIAMSFAIAALRARSAIKILDCDNVGTSYPTFVAHAQKIGLSVQEYQS